MIVGYLLHFVFYIDFKLLGRSGFSHLFAHWRRCGLNKQQKEN